jgi:hypothetical protein
MNASVASVGPSRFPWTAAAGFRVAYFDPKRTGVWHAYFSSEAEAESFAVGKRLYAKPCRVEVRP